MAGAKWTPDDDNALVRAVVEISGSYNDKASLFTAVALRLSRETQKSWVRQAVYNRYQILGGAKAQQAPSGPDTQSAEDNQKPTNKPQGQTKPRTTKETATRKTATKRKAEEIAEQHGPAKKSKTMKEASPKLDAAKASTSSEVTPAKIELDGTSEKEASRLPSHSCILDGNVVISEDPDTFLLPVKVKGGQNDWEGFCQIAAKDFGEEQQKAIRAGTFGIIDADQLKSEAKLLYIDKDDEYAVVMKVTNRAQVYDGACSVPKREIDGELLTAWLAKTGEMVLQSVEEGPDPEVEEANKYNRTVYILGNLAIGERRSMSVKVEIWSWDGKTALETSAKIIEHTKHDNEYWVRLRVKLAEKAYIYLAGWMHEGCFGGRFAEEAPGQLFVD